MRQVDLEAGQVYLCQVKGRWVEARVLEKGKGDLDGLARFDESEVMLDPWVELPLTGKRVRVVGKPGEARLPDSPEIPSV